MRLFRSLYFTETPPGGSPPVVPPVTPLATPLATPPAAPATPPAPAELSPEVKAQLADYEKLKKAAKDADDARLSDIDKANKKAAEADARAVAADKRAAAAAHGLPPELAARLTGTTPEEIEADARKLKALFPAAAATPANSGTPAGGDPKPAGGGDALEKKRAEMAEAQKANNPLAVLRIQREIGALEAAKK